MKTTGSGPVCAALLAALIAAGLAGCGASQPAPAGAARLVPANAIAYVNVSIDRHRPEVTQAAQVTARLPGFRGLVQSLEARLAAITGVHGSFTAAASHWLGGEAALAILPAGGLQANTLILLAVTKPAAARLFLRRTGASDVGAAHGVQVFAYSGGADAAVLDGFMILGEPGSVEAAIADATGSTTTLGASREYRRAVSGEPAGRVLDAYAPAAGVRALLGTTTGIRSALSSLLAPASSTAVALAVTPTADGARIWVRTLRRGRSARRGEQTDGSLASALPAGLALMADVSDLPARAPGLLGVASALGLGQHVAPLLIRLGAALRAEGIAVTPLLSLFSGESAVGVTAAGGVLVVARVHDQQRARITLGNAAAAVSELLPGGGGSGQETQLGAATVAGKTVGELQVGTDLRVQYAVFSGLAVISTSEPALAAMIRDTDPLSGSARYRTVMSGGSGGARTLIFGNVSRLLALAGRNGLLAGAGLGSLLPDLERIRGFGLRSGGGVTQTTAELYLIFT